MINDELLHKFVNGQLTEEETKIFSKRPEFEDLQKIYKNTEHLAAPDLDEEGMLAEIFQKDKKSLAPAVGRRVFMRSWITYAAAACMLLFALWFIWPTDSSVQYQTAMGEELHENLPDQSTFSLKEQSRLSYDASTWANDRALNLEGTAFFQVKKGEKFVVNTPTGKVQVLGTSFNVLSRGSLLEVSCKSGKVAVLSLENNLYTELIPNESVVVDAGVLTKQVKQLDANSDISVFRFKKVKLEEVLTELEQQFSIKFVGEGIDNQMLITCNFKNEDLITALKTSLDPFGIKYQITENGVVKLTKEEQ